jgi:hypothetical protein
MFYGFQNIKRFNGLGESNTRLITSHSSSSNRVYSNSSSSATKPDTSNFVIPESTFNKIKEATQYHAASTLDNLNINNVNLKSVTTTTESTLTKINEEQGFDNSETLTKIGNSNTLYVTEKDKVYNVPEATTTKLNEYTKQQETETAAAQRQAEISDILESAPDFIMDNLTYIVAGVVGLFALSMIFNRKKK